MPGCYDDIETEDLTSCTNRQVNSGVSEVGIFYAIHSQATTIPMPLNPDDAGYTYEKAVKVDTPVVFAAGKGFAKIDAQVDTGEVKVTTVGNKGNKKEKQTFDFFVPGNDAKTLGFVRTHLNTPMLFAVTERGGQKRLLGDRFNPAYMSEVEGTTGKTGEDDKGVQFQIETYGRSIIYDAAVPLYVPA